MRKALGLLVFMAACALTPALQGAREVDPFAALMPHIVSDKMEYWRDKAFGSVPDYYGQQRHIELDKRKLGEADTIALVKKCLAPANGWTWKHERDQVQFISIEIRRKVYRIKGHGKTVFLEFCNLTPDIADIMDVKQVDAKTARSMRKQGIKFEEF